MARNVQFFEDEFYHVYNRGTERRAIFMEEIDYKRFQLLLYVCNQDLQFETRSIFESGKSFPDLFREHRGSRLVEIGAYCLMPNHFHILLMEKVEGGVSLFMKKLGTAYTMSFNKKYKRTGALFQGRFKAKHVDRDEYMRYLYGYIHLNPVKLIDSKWKEYGVKELLKTKKYLDQYKYSSYPDYAGAKRPEAQILETGSYPSYFKNGTEFRSFIDDYLDFDER